MEKAKRSERPRRRKVIPYKSRIHRKGDDDENCGDSQDPDELTECKPGTFDRQCVIDHPFEKRKLKREQRVARSLDNPGRATPGNNGIDNDHRNHQDAHHQPGAPGFLEGYPSQRVPDPGESKEENQEANIPIHGDGEKEKEGEDPSGAWIDLLHDAVAKVVRPGDKHWNLIGNLPRDVSGRFLIIFSGQRPERV